MLNDKQLIVTSHNSHNSTAQGNTALLAAVGIILLCAGIIILNMPHRSLWYDEALTTWVARDSWATLWAWCTHIDIQVPLHYVLLRLWSDLAGTSEFSLRLLSGFGIIIAGAGMVRIGIELRARQAGYIAAILLVTAAGTVWIAYEVRAYAVGLGLYAWATAFLLILVRKSSLRLLLIYCVVMVAVLYTHYTGLGAFAAHLGFLGVRALAGRDKRRWQLLIQIGLICGLCFAPMLPIVFARGDADRSYYTGWNVPPWYTAGTLLGFALTGREDVSNAAPWLAVGFGIFALVIALVGLSLRYIRRTAPYLQRGAHLALWITLLPTVLTMLTVYFRPKLAGRYAWPSWIGLFLLYAIGLYVLSYFVSKQSATVRTPFSKGWAAVLLALGMVTVIFVPGLTIARGHPPDSNFAGAFAYICTSGTPDDVIVLRDGTLFVAYEYYGRRAPCDTPRYATGAPFSLITDVQAALRVQDSAQLRTTVLARKPPTIWVLAWQGDVMDPQGIAYAAFDLDSTTPQPPRTFGDVTVHRIDLTTAPNPAQVQSQVLDLMPLPDSATLTRLELIAANPVRRGGVVILRALWTKGAVLNPALRISARITSVDNGTTYTQIDQPPAGWKYVDDRWIAGDPALGRYELAINADVPPGEVMVRYVIYDADGKFAPIMLDAGKVIVAP